MAHFPVFCWHLNFQTGLGPLHFRQSQSQPGLDEDPFTEAHLLPDPNEWPHPSWRTLHLKPDKVPAELSLQYASQSSIMSILNSHNNWTLKEVCCCFCNCGKSNLQFEEAKQRCRPGQVRPGSDRWIMPTRLSREALRERTKNKQREARARAVWRLIPPGWLLCHFV